LEVKAAGDSAREQVSRVFASIKKALVDQEEALMSAIYTGEEEALSHSAVMRGEVSRITGTLQDDTMQMQDAMADGLYDQVGVLSHRLKASRAELSDMMLAAQSLCIVNGKALDGAPVIRAVQDLDFGKEGISFLKLAPTSSQLSSIPVPEIQVAQSPVVVDTEKLVPVVAVSLDSKPAPAIENLTSPPPVAATPPLVVLPDNPIAATAPVPTSQKKAPQMKAPAAPPVEKTKSGKEAMGNRLLATGGSGRRNSVDLASKVAKKKVVSLSGRHDERTKEVAKAKKDSAKAAMLAKGAPATRPGTRHVGQKR